MTKTLDVVVLAARQIVAEYFEGNDGVEPDRTLRALLHLLYDQDLKPLMQAPNTAEVCKLVEQVSHQADQWQIGNPSS